MNDVDGALDGLDAEERDICVFLSACRDQLASAMEIARRAGGKSRFREDPKWAGRVLLRLSEKGKIESDANGHYRLQALRDKETHKEQEPWSCRGKKILFVNGDADMREVVAGVLQDAGGEISTAMDASDALVQMYDTKLDLIILALNLNGEGGLELVKFLKRNQHDVPVILHPGLSHEDDAILAMLAGKRASKRTAKP